MTKLVVISFVLAAVMAAAGCITADRVRAWRSALNPSASELPGAAFAVGRVVFFGLAGVMVFTGFQLMTVSDNAEWSDDELTSAVRQATSALDGSTHYGDIYGDDSGFDAEYATMIEDKVVTKGSGDAPQLGVDAAPADTNQASDARYTVTASGANTTFCLHIERTRSKDGDWDAPGVAGGEGTVTVPVYEFGVTSRSGAC
jgi:hypothetical protein